MQRNAFGQKAIAAIRTGSWLTPERLRVYPVMIGSGLAFAMAGLVLTGHGGMDHWNRPLGTDFSGLWVAGTEVLAGHPAQPYDNASHAAAQASAFGTAGGFLPWPYPPLFLAVAALVATMPYLVALALYQGVTLAAYCGVVLRAARGSSLARRDVVVAAVAFPAVAINLLHGHNGFLSAALLAGGALTVSRRPGLAGVLFGLLAYKPQFALAIPMALVAGRHWRALAAASTTVVLTTGMTLIAFGLEPWRGFLASLTFTRHVILEMGGLDTFKLQSAFAAVRLVGGSVALAYGVQAIVGGFVLAGLAWLWARSSDERLKVAGLIVGSLLVTPYAVDYDMAMLGPALAALASLGIDRGFAPYRKSALALVWVMPLFARVTAMAVALPSGVLAMGMLFLIILDDARRLDCVASTIGVRGSLTCDA